MRVTAAVEGAFSNPLITNGFQALQNQCGSSPLEGPLSRVGLPLKLLKVACLRQNEIKLLGRVDSPLVFHLPSLGVVRAAVRRIRCQGNNPDSPRKAPSHQEASGTRRQHQMLAGRALPAAARVLVRRLRALVHP